MTAWRISVSMERSASTPSTATPASVGRVSGERHGNNKSHGQTQTQLAHTVVRARLGGDTDGTS